MDECDDDDDDSLRKHSSVTVSDIYALLTYDMSDSVRQLIRYIKESQLNIATYLDKISAVR